MFSHPAARLAGRREGGNRCGVGFGGILNSKKQPGVSEVTKDDSFGCETVRCDSSESQSSNVTLTIFMSVSSLRSPRRPLIGSRATFSLPSRRSE